jgi:hypothetical protein
MLADGRPIMRFAAVRQRRSRASPEPSACTSLLHRDRQHWVPVPSFQWECSFAFASVAFFALPTRTDSA